jgi:phage terminase small subunit
MVIREAIAVQILTAREARERIDREGSVVRDTKGSVVPHPAIKIEADAIKMYTSLVSKHTN